MDCKDLSKDSMAEIRGGRLSGGNTIVQDSANGGVHGGVGVGGRKFNLSPVSIESLVSQQNTTSQGAAISDIREHSLAVGISASQIEIGGWSRLWD